jgi:NADH dehydrogenase (ubiquinone) 1 beta subcomplex subunit 9
VFVYLPSSLYRRSLKLALDWTVNRYLWRGQALYLRGLFEANKHVTQPRQQKVGLHPLAGAD